MRGPTVYGVVCSTPNKGRRAPKLSMPLWYPTFLAVFSPSSHWPPVHYQTALKGTVKINRKKTMSSGQTGARAISIMFWRHKLKIKRSRDRSHHFNSQWWGVCRFSVKTHQTYTPRDVFDTNERTLSVLGVSICLLQCRTLENAIYSTGTQLCSYHGVIPLQSTLTNQKVQLLFWKNVFWWPFFIRINKTKVSHRHGKWKV